MEVFNAIYGRRAVRRYTSAGVSQGTIAELVDAAIQAPSAMNVQPWSFVVIAGSARLRAYSHLAKKYLIEVVDGPLRAAAHMLGPDVNIFHEAPTLIVICATSEDAQAAEDCCLAAQNLMLAAFASGLATCPIGFSRPWLCSAAAKHEIGIPAEWRPVFPLVLGFADEEPSNHGRRAARIVWKDQPV